MKDKIEILVYITDNPEKVISGDPLCLLEKDPEAREQLLADIGKALRADVVRLKNGDHIIISSST
jgi:siroheme synthase